ncbi:hypothetical protein CONLIGDRAFT_702768 [Coniochaeta ligniaria NRRL 30616]|uniref:Uncharacterized protein n=1 Tax=Coniochaeta ligniaria NRRL 30616 TaxID=1408157 RepID=A0A1J7ISR2_9PEZI|nr:hypothetical protein CONLIGDRAFT_702768 [Coniochaeta ligniaria NRRL 30616]
MKLSNVLFHLAASLVSVLAAIKPNGFQPVGSGSEANPVPIADPKTGPYFSVDSLQRCERLMLVQLAIPLALDVSETNILIRSCSLGPDLVPASDKVVSNTAGSPIDNPKTDKRFIDSGLYGGIPQSLAQICGGVHRPETMLGLAVDMTGDLLWAHRIGGAWVRGECATVDDTGTQGSEPLPVKVFDIASAPLDTSAPLPPRPSLGQ